jgi:hypothetical protein
MLSDLALKNKKSQFSNGPQNSTKEGMFFILICFLIILSYSYEKGADSNMISQTQNDLIDR